MFHNFIILTYPAVPYPNSLPCLCLIFFTLQPLPQISYSTSTFHSTFCILTNLAVSYIPLAGSVVVFKNYLTCVSISFRWSCEVGGRESGQGERREAIARDREGTDKYEVRPQPSPTERTNAPVRFKAGNRKGTTSNRWYQIYWFIEWMLRSDWFVDLCYADHSYLIQWLVGGWISVVFVLVA